MKNKIIAKLHEIEEKENVRILYAVESGSRAWGFESVDSDYDIRFIYSHSRDWYLSIEEKRDVIEYPIQKLLDFSGWDIKKALQLYKKSNPSLHEWLSSPIIYLENGLFAQDIRELSSEFYSPISSIYHYLHMAEGNYRTYLQEDMVRVKKYFYVLRPIFACMFIEKHKKQPPMEFNEMLEQLDIPINVKAEIDMLYKRKKAGEELDREKKIYILNNFLQEKIDYYRSYMKTKSNLNKPKSDSGELDNLFMQYVYETNISINSNKSCPLCNSTKVLKIEYGLYDQFPFSKKDNVWLGGCIVSDDSPMWHCEDCSYEWGQTS